MCLRVATCGLVLSALIGTAGVASADWFDDFNGGEQQPWQFFGQLADGTPTALSTAGSVNDRLVLTDATTAANGGPTVGFGVVVSEAFGDVRMSGAYNPDGDININEALMLIARGNLAEGSFYGAEVNYTDSDLIIWRGDAGGGGQNLIVEDVPDLFFTDSVYAEFEVIGDRLRLTAYDSPGGALIASISAIDGTYSAPGLSGVLVDENSPTLPVLGVWDDIRAEAIVGGDYNDDRTVDAADYTVWRDNVGAADGSLPNDPNFNPIGDEQYATWSANYGQAAVAFPLGSVTVPEPIGVTSALCAVAIFGCRGRRGHCGGGGNAKAD